MERIQGRSKLGAIAAAIIGFAMMLVGTATPSTAASYTLNFTGTVTDRAGPFAVIADNGDQISGALTFNTFNDATFVNSSNGVFNGHNFFQFDVSSSLTVNITRGGVPVFVPEFATGIGGVVSDTNGKIARLALFIDNGLDNQLTFSANGNKLLTSLAGLPTTASGLLALLGGSGGGATGTFGNGLGSLSFAIDGVAATTPLPAALPLFLSAIGGLGFAGWRRKQGMTAA